MQLSLNKQDVAFCGTGLYLISRTKKLTEKSILIGVPEIAKGIIAKQYSDMTGKPLLESYLAIKVWIDYFQYMLRKVSSEEFVKENPINYISICKKVFKNLLK